MLLFTGGVSLVIKEKVHRKDIDTFIDFDIIIYLSLAIFEVDS